MASQRYIVVGAGLAGCLTAWRLEQAGQQVTLIGSTQLPSASEAAGGIINPVTGRWMTKSWKFDACIDYAAATYRELEQSFGVTLFHPVPFVRYCQNDEDTKRIRRRMRNPRYADVLGEYIATGKSPAGLKDTHGSFQIKQAAYVNLRRLLQTLRNHFTHKGRFRDTTFAYDELKEKASNWRYHDLEAEHVIFCEGANIRANPWFKQLPLTPVKGETLTLECPTLQLPKTLYHCGKWLLPLEGRLFRIGATYDDGDRSETPTELGRHKLLESFRSFTKKEHAPAIKQHTAGLRPCTRDFRPFVGSHPIAPRLHVFNGLGSKGALLAPELA